VQPSLLRLAGRIIQIVVYDTHLLVSRVPGDIRVLGSLESIKIVEEGEARFSILWQRLDRHRNVLV
jgi:hypothetical protein